MDSDITTHLSLLRLLENLETESANEYVKTKGLSMTKPDTPMRPSLEAQEGSKAADKSQPSSSVMNNTSIRSSLHKLVDSSPVVISGQVPRRSRSLSEADVKMTARDVSHPSTWLPTDIIVRDFASKSSSLNLSPRNTLPAPILLPIRTHKSQPLYPVRCIIPVPTRVRLRDTLKSMSADSTLPPDLSPKHVGKHPIPYTMPSAAVLGMILHPTLVEVIVSSTYQTLVPKDTRCFCSLVLHEIQHRALGIRLEIHGPRDHAHLQSQMRTLLTDNHAVADKVMCLYGDALRMQTRARMNSRPLRLNSWAEIIGMMIEDVFMLGKHRIFDEIEAEGLLEGAGVYDKKKESRAEKRRRRLRLLKYKGSKRVYRSKEGR